MDHEILRSRGNEQKNPLRRQVMAVSQDTAFPQLTTAEIELVRPLARARDHADGEIVFRAGDHDIDLCVVESGELAILNPTDGGKVVVTHKPGQFSGDIDLLTG